MRSPIAASLLADAPRAAGLELFGRFVGCWAFEGWQIGPGREHTPTRGRWDFGYVLGGRAIQDVLRYDNGDCGTTIRFPRGDGSWEVVWISAAHTATHLTARSEGERIVLTGGDGDRKVRWSFNDIASGTFLWRGEELTTDGTFRLAEEIHLTRV
jgi:hypothetical protein